MKDLLKKCFLILFFCVVFFTGLYLVIPKYTIVDKSAILNKITGTTYTLSGNLIWPKN